MKKQIVYNLIDYKGKHEIIQDIGYPDKYGMDFVIGTITKKEALSPRYIENHLASCGYYGIPAYLGGDEDMVKVYCNDEDDESEQEKLQRHGENDEPGEGRDIDRTDDYPDSFISEKEQITNEDLKN